MWSFAVVAVISIVALFLQSTFFRLMLPDSAVIPNLMVTVVAFLAFHSPNPLGLALSFFLGLCLDLGSAVLVGPWAGAFVVVFLLLSSVTQRIFVDSPLTAFVAVLCAALLAQGVFIALSMQFRAFEFEFGALVSQVSLEALFSAFCAPLCFAGLRRLRIVPPQRVV